MRLQSKYYCIFATFCLGTTGCQLLISDGGGGAGSTGTHATGSTGTGSGSTTSSSSGMTVTCPVTACSPYCENYQTNCAASSIYGTTEACCDTCRFDRQAVSSMIFTCLEGYANNSQCAEAGPVGFNDSCGTTKDDFCNLRDQVCGNGGNCTFPENDPGAAKCATQVLIEIATAKVRAEQGGTTHAACTAKVSALCSALEMSSTGACALLQTGLGACTAN